MALPADMAYAELMHNSDCASRAHISDYKLGRFDYMRLANCERLRRWPSGVRLYVDKSRWPLADFPNSPLGWLIMSDRLLDSIRDLVERAVQVFPAPIENRVTGSAVKGYSVVNLLKKVDCINWRQSEALRFEGDVYGFNKLVLKPARAASHHLFRPSGYRGAICSRELMERFSGKKFTGMAFRQCY